MAQPTDDTDTTWVLRRLGTDGRGRIGFIINPDADPEAIVAALHAVVDELGVDGKGEDPE